MKRLLTPAARILGLAMLCLLLGCGKAVVLQSGLNDADANEIVALLRHQGIAAEKHAVKGVVNLQVPEDALARATEAMQSAGLPRRGLSDLGQVFKKEGMISTPLEERVRYLHGLSEELAATLQQIDGVVTARVHVVLPERIAPGEPVQPSSAAVFIKMRAPFDEDATVPRIRRMVAGSIPGLSGDGGIEKVSVILAPAAVAPPDVAWHTAYGVTVLAASSGRLDALVWGLGALAAAALLALAGLGLRRWLPPRRGVTP
jgi:type III secretion protein J